MDRGREAAAHVGLDLDEAFVLTAAAGTVAGGIERGALLPMLGCSQPALSRMLNRMEDKGLVYRAVPPGDRRAVTVVVDAAGWEAIEALDGPGREAIAASQRPLAELRRAAASAGLTELQLRVLFTLAEGGGGAQLVASRAGANRTSCAMALKALCTRGLAKRSRPSGPSRAAEFRISAEGEDLLAACCQN